MFYRSEIRFGLVPLFNGISTFVDYLIPKLSLWKMNSDANYLIADGIRGFHVFPRNITLKVNVITRLEFELVYFKATVQHFSYYATH